MSKKTMFLIAAALVAAFLLLVHFVIGDAWGMA
jgi:hypothetical protein